MYLVPPLACLVRGNIKSICSKTYAPILGSLYDTVVAVRRPLLGSAFSSPLVNLNMDKTHSAQTPSAFIV